MNTAILLDLDFDKNVHRAEKYIIGLADLYESYGEFNSHDSKVNILKFDDALFNFIKNPLFDIKRDINNIESYFCKKCKYSKTIDLEFVLEILKLCVKKNPKSIMYLYSLVNTANNLYSNVKNLNYKNKGEIYNLNKEYNRYLSKFTNFKIDLDSETDDYHTLLFNTVSYIISDSVVNKADFDYGELLPLSIASSSGVFDDFIKEFNNHSSDRYVLRYHSFHNIAKHCKNGNEKILKLDGPLMNKVLETTIKYEKNKYDFITDIFIYYKEIFEYLDNKIEKNTLDTVKRDLFNLLKNKLLTLDDNIILELFNPNSRVFIYDNYDIFIKEIVAPISETDERIRKLYFESKLM